MNGLQSLWEYAIDELKEKADFVTKNADVWLQKCLETFWLDRLIKEGCCNFKSLFVYNQL